MTHTGIPWAMLMVTVFLVGLLLLLFVRGGRRGRWILAVVVGMLCLAIIVAVTSRRVRVSVSHTGWSYEHHVPEVWQAGMEEEFEADVYPSMVAAAKALGRQVVPFLPTVVPDNQMPALVQVCGEVDAGKISVHSQRIKSEILSAVLSGMHGENVDLKFKVERWILPEPIERTDRSAVTARVFGPRSSTSRLETSNSTKFERSGSLSIQVSGAEGQFTRSAEFVEKPWVDDFAKFLNRNPNRAFMPAFSQTACTSEAEAQQEAMEEACSRVAHMLKQAYGRQWVLPEELAVSQGDIRKEGLISDRFVQSFDGTAGRIWREAILIETSPEKLEELMQKKVRQLWSTRAALGRAIISIIGMVVLICVVYLFLDAATRGYYTVALRIAAVVLGVVGVFLILIFSRGGFV